MSKLFRGGVARDVFARATLDRFAIDVEALALARDQGHTIAEVAVVWRNNPQTGVRLLRDGLRMLIDVWGLRGDRRRQALKRHQRS